MSHAPLKTFLVRETLKRGTIESLKGQRRTAGTSGLAIKENRNDSLMRDLR